MNKEDEVCKYNGILHSHMKVKVTQSCLTLCHPMDYTVHEFSRSEYWSG